MSVDFYRTCELWKEGDEIIADFYVGGGEKGLTVHEANLYIHAE